MKRAVLEADVAKSAKRIMNHMNSDHEDSNIAYVLAFATGIEGEEAVNTSLSDILDGKLTITSAQLTDVDADGFLLEVKAQESPESEQVVLSNVRVPYHEPIESAKDIHLTAVAMHRKAYDKLGVWYKVKKGYYKQVAKFVAFKSYKAIQKSSPGISVVAAGATALVAVGAAAGYLRKTKMPVPKASGFWN